jgi:hypothetical protein
MLHPGPWWSSIAHILLFLLRMVPHLFYLLPIFSNVLSPEVFDGFHFQRDPVIERGDVSLRFHVSGFLAHHLHNKGLSKSGSSPTFLIRRGNESGPEHDCYNQNSAERTKTCHRLISREHGIYIRIWGIFCRSILLIFLILA